MPAARRAGPPGGVGSVGLPAEAREVVGLEPPVVHLVGGLEHLWEGEGEGEGHRAGAPRSGRQCWTWKQRRGGLYVCWPGLLEQVTETRSGGLEEISAVPRWGRMMLEKSKVGHLPSLFQTPSLPAPKTTPPTAPLTAVSTARCWPLAAAAPLKCCWESGMLNPSREHCALDPRCSDAGARFIRGIRLGCNVSY